MVRIRVRVTRCESKVFTMMTKNLILQSMPTRARVMVSVMVMVGVRARVTIRSGLDLQLRLRLLNVDDGR